MVKGKVSIMVNSFEGKGKWKIMKVKVEGIRVYADEMKGS